MKIPGHLTAPFEPITVTFETEESLPTLHMSTVNATDEDFLELVDYIFERGHDVSWEFNQVKRTLELQFEPNDTEPAHPLKDKS